MSHTNTTRRTASTTGPEHTFLRSNEVFVRYGWGRTKGYQMLGSRGFPRPVGGTYRLDTLIDWEERVLSGTLESEPPAADPVAPATSVAAEVPDELPTRSRTRGANRKKAA